MDVVTTDWTNLREFRAVDLAKTFVLSWAFDGGSLLIDLDLYLCPDHAFYEPPRPAEGACYRPAMLEFPHCTAIIRMDEKTAPASIAEKVPMLAHGRISDLRLIADGKYEFEGEFGAIVLHADRPILRLSDAAA